MSPRKAPKSLFLRNDPVHHETVSTFTTTAVTRRHNFYPMQPIDKIKHFHDIVRPWYSI